MNEVICDLSRTVFQQLTSCKQPVCLPSHLPSISHVPSPAFPIIVIVISRFLERPQKRSHGNQLIHRRLTKTKSIGSGHNPLLPPHHFICKRIKDDKG